MSEKTGEVTRSQPTIESTVDSLRDGSLTCVELVRSCIERADRLDSVLGTYLARFDETALTAADAADRELAAGLDRGPLHGIPVGVKDIVAAAEGPTTGQSETLPPDWWTGEDAPAVSRLRAAGAVITGKTTTLEFASGFPDLRGRAPIPRNPWNLDAWAGGSSSGSANGLVAGMFLGAVGTDTGASIRMPSAFCGVTGLLPTYDLVPTSRVLYLAPSLDRVGPMARTAWDCAVLLRAMCEGETKLHQRLDSLPDRLRDGGSAESLAGLTIGVVRRQHFPEGSDPDAPAVFEHAVDTLVAAGARVREVELPLYEQVTAAGTLTSLAESFNEHRKRLSESWSRYLPSTKQVIGLGAFVGASDYLQAQKLRRAAQEELAVMFESLDALVMPTASVSAFSFDEIEESGLLVKMAMVHTFYWNAVGNPVLALPMGRASTGLPLGMQVAGRPFEDDLLLRIGWEFQRRTAWHQLVPAEMGRPE